MTRKLFLQPFESTISESWEWLTNVLNSVTNNEQRIALREYPDETLTISWRIGKDGAPTLVSNLNAKDAVISSFRDLITCVDLVSLPMWHLLDYVQTAASSWLTGTRRLSFRVAPGYSPFSVFQGESVLVQNGSAGWLVGTIETFDLDTLVGAINFGVDSGATISNFGQIVPIRDGLIQQDSTQEFYNAADGSDVKFSVLLSRNNYRRALSGSIPVNTDSFSVLPILDVYNQSASLSIAVKQGTTKIETPTGFPFAQSLWKETGFSFEISDKMRRVNHDSDRTFFRNLSGVQYTFATDDPKATLTPTGELERLPTYGAQANLPVVAATTGTIPTTLVGGRKAPYFNGAKALRTGVSAQKFLDSFHLAATSGSMWFVINRGAAFVTTGRPISNRTSTAGALGTIFRLSLNNIDFRVGDGVTDQIVISGPTTLTFPGFYVVEIRKELLVFSIYVNGAFYASATAASLAASGSANEIAFAGTETGTVTLTGDDTLTEFAYFNRVLTSSERTRALNYLERWHKSPSVISERRISGRYLFWRSFLDRLKGSQGRFWLPTRRADFEIVSVPTGGVVLKGRQYFDLWNETNLKALCLDNGVDPLKVVQVIYAEIDDNGNSVAYFQSFIGLATITVVSLAFPCRVSDSQNWTHAAYSSDLAITAQTIQITFTPQVVPTPIVDVYPDNAGAVTGGSPVSFSSIPDAGSYGGNWTQATFGNQPFRSYWKDRRSAIFQSLDRLEPSVPMTQFDFLRYRFADFTILFRFRLNLVSTSNWGMLMTTAGNGWRWYIDKTLNRFTFENGGTTMATAGGSVPQTGDFSALMTRKNGVTTISLSMAQGSPFALLLSSAAAGVAVPDAIGPLVIGWLGSNAIQYLGQMQIWNVALTSAQAEIARKQLCERWPDIGVELWRMAGDDSGAVLSAPFNYDSIPCTGEYAGTAGFIVDKPARKIVNGLTAPKFVQGLTDLQVSALAGVGVWSFLHNNSVSWQFSLAVSYELNFSNGVPFNCFSTQKGFGLQIDKAAGTIRAEIFGTAGTFFALATGVTITPGNGDVIEVRFTSGGTPTLQIWQNDLLVGSGTPAGFTFNAAAQTAEPHIGGQSNTGDLAVCEAVFRTDTTSQTLDLRDKWFPGLWASMLIATGDFILDSVDGDAWTA